MSLEDCCRYYTNIEICGMRPDFLDEEPACHWKTSMYENRWVAGTTAGGYINHKGKNQNQNSTMAQHLCSAVRTFDLLMEACAARGGPLSSTKTLLLWF